MSCPELGKALIQVILTGEGHIKRTGKRAVTDRECPTWIPDQLSKLFSGSQFDSI